MGIIIFFITFFLVHYILIGTHLRQMTNQNYSFFPIELYSEYIIYILHCFIYVGTAMVTYEKCFPEQEDLTRPFIVMTHDVYVQERIPTIR